jgi:hypothetical protein
MERPRDRMGVLVLDPSDLAAVAGLELVQLVPSPRGHVPHSLADRYRSQAAGPNRRSRAHIPRGTAASPDGCADADPMATSRHEVSAPPKAGSGPGESGGPRRRRLPSSRQPRVVGRRAPRAREGLWSDQAKSCVG